MDTDTIAESDFKAFVEQRLAEVMTHPALLKDRIQEVMDFAVENESRMDAGAKAYFDLFVENIVAMFEIRMAGAPDSPEKRRILRLVAFARSKHYKAENFFKGLGLPLPKPYPVAEAGKPIFFDVVQSILDLLFDATREQQHGSGQFASLSMLYWTHDEMLVAFYLLSSRAEIGNSGLQSSPHCARPLGQSGAILQAPGDGRHMGGQR